MKIISIQILAVEPARSAIPAVPVAAALNLSSFSFYQRSVRVGGGGGGGGVVRLRMWERYGAWERPFGCSKGSKGHVVEALKVMHSLLELQPARVDPTELTLLPDTPRHVRVTISQFMDFFSRTVAERTAPGQRQSVEQESASTAYTAHAYTRASDNLAGVIITDQEYPVRVAFSLINKILDEFTTQVKRDVWEAKARESRQAGKQYLVEFPQLQEYCTKYQDPKQADTIMKVQQELDETKIILHKTIESVLERGEKLDSLVDKSAALSASSVQALYRNVNASKEREAHTQACLARRSKNFYKTAQKQNSCCVVM
ncbi:BZ3500_MvSof-1268-A1-R1_Chr5-2g08121 [Microbotryum saponariae]|uniref:Synaptobrevin homolog YKT6 n=1 Tax=Microbotryum saponariae TaxID=289078 RepID=A0A2X0LL63_9BASI|nr:BZ3500_MvSof-1268-A1-R1_Chr5-2g08121 [Microbotryum saponariae]SDA05990.1 BZ3501_MvSof-1269-A2-R1_Chr5-2g07943 [Microbotryum saponariae]